MNQPLPRIGHTFGDKSLALTSGDLARSLAGCALWQMCGMSTTAGTDATAGKPGLGNRALQRRVLVQIGLMALAFGLLLGRVSTAGVLGAGEMTPSPDGLNRCNTAVQALSEPLAGVVRHQSGWTLRWGRWPRLLFPTVRLDDPNDDETSDDPTDDDDGWEGLNALGETEVPVPAWFQQVGCYHSDLETQSEPLRYETFLLTSFLTLQRLRC
jgi:hypothetical protein